MRFWGIFSLLVLIALGLTVSGCGASGASAEIPADLPIGDVSRGATLYRESINGAPSCVGCHSTDGTVLVGPSLQGYAANAKAHADGKSIEAYTYSSIVQPANYLVSGFGNVMYAQYGRQLSSQQIADLIAYLLTL